jgi:hypothetical protein
MNAPRAMQPDDTAWFVLFPAKLSGPPLWWQRLLARGYRHCLALRAEGEARTLIVEHAGVQLRVETVAMPVAVTLRGLQAELVAAALMVGMPPAAGTAPWRPSMTCVEAVKAAIGLSSPWILTPRQLARHLRRRHGAVHVLPT